MKKKSAGKKPDKSLADLPATHEGGLQDALRRSKERRQAFREELDRLTFKSTSRSAEERITKVIHGPHPAYQHAEEKAELVKCRQTLLLALLIEHCLGAKIISETEIDHMLLWVAREA